MLHKYEPAKYSDAATYWTVFVDGAAFLTVIRPSYFERHKGKTAEAFYPNGALAFRMPAHLGSRVAVHMANGMAMDVVQRLNAGEVA